MHDNLVYNNGGRGLWMISGGNAYNNTIYGTVPGFGQDGLCVDNVFSGATVMNNICFENARNIIKCRDNPCITAANLFTDPSFVDAPNADFRLRAGSAAIDAGVPITGLITDMQGIARPQDFAVTIGAYEYNK